MKKQFEWMGRVDPEDGEKAKRWHQVVCSGHTDNTIAALVGFACDLGVKRNKGRIGAKAGPDAIRAALANMAWHGGDGSVLDMQDISVDEDDNSGDALLTAQARLGGRVHEALEKCQKALVLGGGHETAAGSFNGLLKYLEEQPKKQVGIINLDAHFDLRKPGKAGASSGTPFYQIHDMLATTGRAMNYLCLGVAEISNTRALFERSREWQVDYMLDRDVRSHLMDQVRAKIDAFLQECDVLYLTIDLDVLPHWQMPAVSAPAPYGVALDVVEDIVDHLAQANVDWPLSDVVEFNPDYDVDGCAAKVAARLCDKIIRAMT